MKSSWENHLFRFHCANHSEKPLKAKIVSAMASTIFESYIHWTNMESGGIFFLLLLTFSEKTAHYDLIKIKDESGKESYGV
ncbi:MAG: hypothetical protein EGR13_10125, partial [Coprococcus comes]|nr:hypothetical protein [Coprococcus comes]